MTNITRKAPYKHADGSNCWTLNCSRNHAPTTTPNAQAWLTTKPSAAENPDDVARILQGKVARPVECDYDVINHEVEYIRKWEEDWTDADKHNLELVNQISDIVARDPFTPADEAAVNALRAQMIPAKERVRPRYGFSSNDTTWRARDKMLHELAKDLLVRRKADEINAAATEPVTNPRLLNLEAAQQAALKAYNEPDHLHGKSYEGNVAPYLQDAVARQIRGDATTANADLSLYPARERMFGMVNPDANGAFVPQLYLAAVFPVNELKTEMDRVGIDNVAVTHFYNTREWGNAYTVLTPDGGTRTFVVYEHRNTDSIIINGMANWDGEELPYAGATKNDFFAEFGPDDQKRAAQALAFYLAQAQSGELDEDAELLAKATHRDWNAILDASIPGFKEWRQSKITDTYIAPADETDEDILNRLDF